MWFSAKNFPGFNILMHLFRCRALKLDRYDGWDSQFVLIYHDLWLKTTVFSLIFSNFRWISHSKLPRHQSQKHSEIGTFYMKTVNFHQKRPFYWCFIHNILKWAHFYQKPYVASSYFAFLYLFWPFVKEFLVRSHTEYWAAGR